MEAKIGGFKMKKLILLIIFQVLLLISAALAEPVYDVIDLGKIPGTDYSEAYSISGKGQIVGMCSLPSILGRATLFDPTGAGNNTDLGTHGRDLCYASSINDSGQIVGRANNAAGHSRATLFDSSGGGSNIDLGTLGGIYSQANSINNSGKIAGLAYNTSNQPRATLFSSTGDGNNINLGTLGGDYSSAYSINDSGQIVGYAQNASSVWRATLFDSTGGGKNLNLGTLPSGGHSEALSINNSGQIVGYAQNASGDYRATLFDTAGSGNNNDLGTLGGNDSYAVSINDLGQIVGYAQNASGDYRATLFDISGIGDNIDLNTLIDPGLGWTLRDAYGINDNDWIVGYGYNPTGRHRAFLLRPRNTAPVAIAGPNQVVYVCSDDELTDVNLDGSGSYDDNNDCLDYYWSWTVDGNICEANGVSPTIQLPAGEYEIELVVDDGIDFSEPNYCTITVIKPLHAKLQVMPRFLNTQSRRRTITAIVYMPQGITPEDIDANEPLVFIHDSNEIESTRQFVSKWNMHGRPRTWVLASFDKDDCIDILSLGLNRIKVTGRLSSGRCYYGNSCIYVFKPRPFRRPWKFPK